MIIVLMDTRNELEEIKERIKNMVCLHTDCLFRVNSFGGENNCDCSACPNRYTGIFNIQTEKTLTADEIKEFEKKLLIYADFVVGGMT